MEWSHSGALVGWLVTLDWLEIIGFVEMVFMPSFYGVNKAGSSETIFGGYFVNFFLCFKSFMVHGMLIYYITLQLGMMMTCHFPISHPDL